MSLSKKRETGARNPSKKFIEWKGARTQGFFQYYNKDIEDKAKRQIKVDLKDFVVLDKDLFSVNGFNDDTKTSYSSNEVRTVEDQLTVRSYKDKKSTIILQGSYAELKELGKIKEWGLKYTKCIYIFFNGEVCHLKLHGAAFKQWIDTVDANPKGDASLISFGEKMDGVKGKLEFTYPTFIVGGPIPDDIMEAAMKADSEILQPYLESYLNKKGAAPTQEEEKEQEQDTTKWRNAEGPDGSYLGTYSLDELEELYTNIDDNDPLVNFIGQAMYDIGELRKT